MGFVLTLEQRGGWDTDPSTVKNPPITFGSSPKLSYLSLLMSKSLTNNINSQFTHILYVMGTICCILTGEVGYREENVTEKILRKRKYIHSRVCILGKMRCEVGTGAAAATGLAPGQ